MLIPLEIPQFVDFYSGINHASNVGRMFRPDMAPLLPNYRHLPVGYNGRASTVYPSDKVIRRPKGQTKSPESDIPVFGPTKELDFELELGFFIAEGNEEGEMISVGSAADHMLGLVLVNDWSARDFQRWEYQPLGPFLAKSFATTISPWVVSLDALDPFRVEGQLQDPMPLEHLARGERDHYDIVLEVSILTPKMSKPQVVCRSNAKHLYWSLSQMLAHQTSNGTKVESGDLYASGTISGETEDSFGSLLELSWKGSKPLTMTETGEQRTFLEDGDTVIFTGYCQGDGYRIGFGELRISVG
jgi:fumarylacetoacetase